VRHGQHDELRRRHRDTRDDARHRQRRRPRPRSATLTQAEFLYETARYPDAEYSFKHPLTQEVAYHSQLRERRAATHGAGVWGVCGRSKPSSL